MVEWNYIWCSYMTIEIFLYLLSSSTIVMVADDPAVTRLLASTAAIKLCGPSTVSSSRIVIATDKVVLFTEDTAGTVTTSGAASE